MSVLSWLSQATAFIFLFFFKNKTVRPRVLLSLKEMGVRAGLTSLGHETGSIGSTGQVKQPPNHRATGMHPLPFLKLYYRFCYQPHDIYFVSKLLFHVLIKAIWFEYLDSNILTEVCTMITATWREEEWAACFFLRKLTDRNTKQGNNIILTDLHTFQMPLCLEMPMLWN